MSPVTRFQLLTESDARMNRAYYRPLPPRVAPAENRRRWSTVLVTLIASLPLLRAVILYTMKGDN